MLSLALPKGDSLGGGTLELFRLAGMEIVSKPREYTVKVSTPSLVFEVVMMRSAHIPGLVASGNYDAGICGQDRVLEEFLKSGAVVEERIQLPYNRSTRSTHGPNVSVVLFGPEDAPAQKISEIKSDTKIFTEFPKITEKAFRDARIPVEIVECRGSAESHVSRDYPYGVCIVETKKTLRANKQKIIEILAESTTGFFANLDALKDPVKLSEINQITSLLENAMQSQIASA